MGLFNKGPLKKIFAGYDREDHEDIFETAKLISGNDPEIAAAMDAVLTDPIKYMKENAERFSERGIYIDDPDSFGDLDDDELLFLGMLDELEEHNFAFEFDWKCELEDFLWGLEQTKNYSLIADTIKNVKLDESEDIEAWGKEINLALGEKAFICTIDIDSDSYPITILTAETLEKIPIPMVMSM